MAIIFIVYICSGITIETTNTKYSYEKTLKFKSITDEDRGGYMCRARYINQPDRYESREINVFIHDPKAPEWSYTNLDPKVKIVRNIGDALDLECNTEAMPQAKVRWFKDDVELHETNTTHIRNDDTNLLIPHLYPKHDGIYKCVVENRLGSIERSATVVIASGFYFYLFIVVYIYVVPMIFCRYARNQCVLDMDVCNLLYFSGGALCLLGRTLSQRT